MLLGDFIPNLVQVLLCGSLKTSLFRNLGTRPTLCGRLLLNYTRRNLAQGLNKMGFASS